MSIIKIGSFIGGFIVGTFFGYKILEILMRFIINNVINKI